MDGTTRRLVAAAAGLVALVFAVGAAVAVARYDGTPVYEARTVLTIDQPLAIAVTPGPGVLDKLARLRFKYAGLLRTDELVAPIGDDTGLDRDAVAGALTAQIPADSLLFVVAARSPDRSAAEAIAESAADTLIEYTRDEQAEAGIPEDQRFEFRVVTATSAPRDIKDRAREALPVVAAALGLLVAAGVLVWALRRD